MAKSKAQKEAAADLAPVNKNNGLVTRMASKFGINPEKMMSTLKSTAFRVKGDDQATDEQMMALLVVAEQYGLNPWTKEIFAFPDKQNGIIPVVGVDGWSRIINTNERFDGLEFIASENWGLQDAAAKNCPDWIECVIYRKDRKHPVSIREYLDEVYRPPFIKTGSNGYTINGPWQSHTKRMLRHKAMIQCARIAFGFVGIYDLDEAERIMEEIDITPEPKTVTRSSASAVRNVMDDVDAQQDKSDTTIEGEFHEATVIPTYAEIADALNTAQTVDAIDDAGSVINAVDDKTQRKELADLYAERRLEIVKNN